MRSFDYKLADKKSLEIDGESLTIQDVVAVARFRRRVKIAKTAQEKIERCRAMVEVLLDSGEKVYGLTTGFGKLRDIVIESKDAAKLQQNLIQSHACGVGKPFPEDVVRAAILLRANTLCKGNSGARLILIQQLVNMLNDDIFPYIPEKGSVGASGDLAPLSHLGLLLTGDKDGRYYPRSRRADEKEVIANCVEQDFIGMPGIADLEQTAKTEGWKFRPLQLKAKEGLAINNGTQFMTAVGCLSAYDAFFTLRYAELAGAMSFEANRGIRGAYDDRIHYVRDHAYQKEAAQRTMAYCDGSQIIDLYFNSAHFNRAVMHLDEAVEMLGHAAADFSRKGLDLPEALEDINRAIARLTEQMSELAENIGAGRIGIDDITRFNKKSPRKQIAELGRMMAPFRQLAVEILKTAEEMDFPNVPEVGKARSALVAAVDRLKKVVPDSPLIQDDYSFRCFPQVLGSVYNALWHVCDTLAVEINSATDNPLLFPPLPPKKEREKLQKPNAYKKWLRENIERAQEGVIGGGNFHGEPVAIAMDYLAIALSEAASISERHVAHLVDGNLSRGLPDFLIRSSGLNSGFMIPQYTAASLVSENKVLAHPASVDSIPTCANTEDHVSMGSIAARKAAEVVANVRLVLAIELLAAYQGLQFRLPLKPGKMIGKAIDALEKNGIRHYDDDRVIYPDIQCVRKIMSENSLLDCLLK